MAIKRFRTLLLAAGLTALAVLPPTMRNAAHPLSAATAGGCAVFPADNPWNQDISNAPLDPNSNNFISSIGGSTHLHPDFGSDPTYGIPYIVVPGTQPLVPITFTASGSESDPGPYPIPANAPVESGSDRHVLVVDSGNCTLYEMFNAQYNGTGWNADSGAVFNLNSNKLRPDGWTSADAAGLPIFAGLARYDEATAGEIKHALRFTVASAQTKYIHPATHEVNNDTNPNDPPMGLRLRLKANFDLSSFTSTSKVILTALKKYGMFVADIGTSWYISGSTDTRWDDNDLNQIKTVPGSAFEVVQSLPTTPQTDTIGVYRPSGNSFFLRNANSTGFASLTVAYGTGSQKYPVVGDWPGLGFQTIGLYDQSNGQFQLRDSNTIGAADQVFTLGNPGDQPLSGRWNKIAPHDSVGVFRSTNGLIYLRNTLDTGYADFTMVLGIPGDVGLAGDWTAKGFDSPGVYRPNDQHFYLSNVVTNGAVFGDITLQYGNAGDSPVVGDWISQGHDGIGLFRKTDGYTYLRNTLTTGYADIPFVYGIAGDIPVAGHWQLYPPNGPANVQYDPSAANRILVPGSSSASAPLSTAPTQPPSGSIHD